MNGLLMLGGVVLSLWLLVFLMCISRWMDGGKKK